MMHEHAPQPDRGRFPLDDPRGTSSDLRALQVIFAHQQKEGWTYFSHRYLADKLGGMSRRGVQKLLARLLAEGLIQVRHRKGGKAQYRTNPMPPVVVRLGGQAVEFGGGPAHSGARDWRTPVRQTGAHSGAPRNKNPHSNKRGPGDLFAPNLTRFMPFKAHHPNDKRSPEYRLAETVRESRKPDYPPLFWQEEEGTAYRRVVGVGYGNTWVRLDVVDEASPEHRIESVTVPLHKIGSLRLFW